MTDKIVYMTADEEDFYKVAEANEPLNEDGSFVNECVTVRDKAEIIARAARERRPTSTSAPGRSSPWPRP